MKEKLDHDNSKWDSDQVSHSKNLTDTFSCFVSVFWMPSFLKMIILDICWHCGAQTLNLEIQ